MLRVEKVVGLYTKFFQARDPRRVGTEFWEELFLLPINVESLEGHLEKLTQTNSQTVINEMTRVCSVFMEEENDLRCVHAIETLCVVMSHVFNLHHSSGAFGIDTIHLLCGVQTVDSFFQIVCKQTRKILNAQGKAPLKKSILTLLQMVIAATDNINQNLFLEYFMIDSIVDSLFQVARNPETRLSLSSQYLFVLMCLTHYKRYEFNNPYVEALTALNDITTVQALCDAIDYLAKESIQNSSNAEVETTTQWIFNSIAKIVISRTIVDNENVLEPSRPFQKHLLDIVILSMYNITQYNPIFYKSLIREESQPNTQKTKSKIYRTNQSTPNNSITFCRVDNYIYLLSQIFPIMHTSQIESTTKLALLTISLMLEKDDICEELFSYRFHKQNFSSFNFLSFSSFESQNHFLQSNQITHTSSPTSTSSSSSTSSSYLQPFASLLVHILALFISKNLRKKLMIEQYEWAFVCVHRIVWGVCSKGVLLQTDWIGLWSSLILFLSFVSSGSVPVIKDEKIASLCEHILRIFNTVLLFGIKTFPPSQIDRMCYEIVRNFHVFERVSAGVLVWGKSQILLNLMRNINIVKDHFGPIAKEFIDKNGDSSIDELLKLFSSARKHLQLSSDVANSISVRCHVVENPKEISFFNHHLRQFLSEQRQTICLSKKDLREIDQLLMNEKI